MKSEEEISKKLKGIKNQISEFVDKGDTESLQFHRTVAKREELEWVLEN